MNRKDHTLTNIAIIVAFVVGAALLAVTHSHFEARAYNRVTGSDVTTWEAVWLNLRVDRGAR